MRPGGSRADRACQIGPRQLPGGRNVHRGAHGNPPTVQAGGDPRAAGQNRVGELRAKTHPLRLSHRAGVCVRRRCRRAARNAPGGRGSWRRGVPARDDHRAQGRAHPARRGGRSPLPLPRDQRRGVCMRRGVARGARPGQCGTGRGTQEDLSRPQGPTDRKRRGNPSHIRVIELLVFRGRARQRLFVRVETPERRRAGGGRPRHGCAPGARATSLANGAVRH
mmetsp:Transcript_30232/g.71915  ORF Transcript_30232/g.71915 Transcript_30232/m.71915 type:complete len:222 (+) Transcript_30232:1499-2164(+)